MTVGPPTLPAFPYASRAVLWLTFGVMLSGCAQMGDTMSSAFADPAKYDLYDCKQLETERKSLATRAADLQALMTKAETGVGGSVVSELAYRNDYISLRGQMNFADDVWRRNNCREGAVSSKPTAPTRPDIKPAPPSKSGSAVY